MTRHGGDFKIVGDKISFKVSDRLGAERMSFDSDVVVSEFNNLPYGQQLKNSNVKFGFNGKELDDTDNYYFNARYYDYDSSKFLGVDPVSDNHAYAFVSNNPMNFVDPSGMDKAEVKKYKKYIKQRESTKFGDPLVTAGQYLLYSLIPDSTFEELTAGRLRPIKFIMRYLAGKGGKLEVEYSKEEWGKIISSANEKNNWKKSTDPNFPAKEGWEIASSFDTNELGHVNAVWDILGTTSLLREKTGTDTEGNDIYFYGIYGEDFDFVGGNDQGGGNLGAKFDGEVKNTYVRFVDKDFFDFFKKTAEFLGSKKAFETLIATEDFGSSVQLLINSEVIETHGTSVVVSAYIDNYKEEETKEKP